MRIVPTPEQQRIIEHPLAPLRIVAGAGTGKTTTVILRLAHLVESGAVDPTRCLGITFTNKAAAELADGIRRTLPDLAARGDDIEVLTYHGFASTILGEFGPLIGVDRAFELIPAGYQRQIMRDALASEPFGDLTSIAHRVEQVARLGGAADDHLVDIDDLAARPVPDMTDPDVEEQRTLIARTLVAYQRRRRQLGLLDYGDLISLAYRVVTEHPHVAEEIRSRYDLVLLDEYQDTNPAQRSLLLATFGRDFPMTAVGDVDQTIYEWRGASPHNFEAFVGDFTDATTHSLTVNRRSGRSILAAANEVRSRIDGASTRPDLVPLDDAIDGSIRAAWHQTETAEAAWIADEIARIHDEDGVRWKDIAILVRQNARFGPLRTALEDRGVPVEIAALGGLLQVPEVADLAAWLRVIGRPEDAPALVRLLLGAHFRLGMGDLAPLALWVREHGRASRDDEALALGYTHIEALEHLDELDGLTPAARTRLERFAQWYRHLVEMSQSASLVELTREILDLTGAWAEIEAMDGTRRMSTRLNVYRFLDLAENWSPLSGRPSLVAFLEYLDLLAEEDRVVELDTAPIGDDDAVALLTVHRAKGLEWPVVFLPGLASKLFPVEGRPFDDPMRRAEVLPGSLRLDASVFDDLPEADEPRRDALRDWHLDQEWRTAYVAVTRARELIVATGSFYTSPTRPKSPSQLFEVLAHHGDLEQPPGEAGPAPTLQAVWTDVADPDPLFEDGWQSALARAIDDPSWPATEADRRGIGGPYDAAVAQLRLTLENLPAAVAPAADPEPFTTSVTGLVTFATCPLRFHWAEVDRLPRRPSAARRRGVDVHRRIELHNLGRIAFEDLEPDHYDTTPTEETASAETPATRGYDAFVETPYAAIRPKFIETPFDLVLDEGRVRGRIDAIYEPEPRHWEVVDFKSGRRRDDPAAEVQLQAYAVATRHVDFGVPRPDRLTMSFLYLGDGAEAVTVDADDAWVQGAEDRVRSILVEAASGHREPAPSTACASCDFLHVCPAGRSFLETR